VKEKCVRLEMGHGRAAAADAASKPQSSQQLNQHDHSGQSDGETTADGLTSDDVEKREPEPCDVEDIKIAVEDC